MAKYQDRKSLGSSSIIPYKENEDASDRHFRRYKENNLQGLSEVAEFCQLNNWLFKQHNDNHHWSFSKYKTTVDWWPSSAKLVINKNFKKGVHCHDYLKLITVLQKY